MARALIKRRSALAGVGSAGVKRWLSGIPLLTTELNGSLVLINDWKIPHQYFRYFCYSIMPRGPKKRKTGKGKTATSKKIALSSRFDFATVQVHQLQQVSRHPWWCSLHSRQFDFKWAPGPFLPLFIAKFWSRYNTSIPTPNQSSSPLWIAASTPDTVPAIPCPLVKRLQPLHQSLCNVWSPPGQSWWSSGGSAFKISALA